jgi:LysR family glycine cleavage system transcriptional activator
MRMRRLPPFLPLVAFDAVVRHGSFTRAAAELGVTQSAVSHQLRRLEHYFDARLLQRLNPGVVPTQPGAALAVEVAELLEKLGGLGRQLRRAPSRPALRVGVGAALATWWLVRRLPGFAAAHPGSRIELVTVATRAEADAPDLDVRILWVPVGEARRSTTQAVLFRERVFPVCRPSLLRGGATLATLPLLHKGREHAQGAEWNWPTWLARLGIKRAPDKSAGELRFNDLGPALAAAVEGGGVALARSLLVRDALADRRLARVLPARHDMTSSKIHVARWPAALIGDARVRAFVTWLGAEAARAARA